jgi:predicted esterase
VSGARLDEWSTLKFPPDEHYPKEQRAEVLRQKGAPLLVALHGRGEAGRGLPAGAGGWRDEYHLDKARARLAAPPLKSEDFLGFVTPGRLKELNASLKQNAYEGIAVACPYTPALPDRSLAGSREFARFVTQSLIPEAAKAAQTKVERSRTGIDGVSMGGRLALLVGLAHPEVFGAVGAMQPAIGPSEADELADLAAGANARQPIALRLVSSEDDPFLAAVRALGEALHERDVKHQLVVTPGPHDYAWNQGPGSYEMLLWHERVLRGLPPP